jgi:lysozyme
MKTNKEGINLIKHFESLHDGNLKQIGLQPKMDPIGIWTEGYGRALRDDKGKFIKGAANIELAYKKSKIHTEEDAIKALAEDLTPREHIVAQNIKVAINENQFSALVSYVYNTGGSSTLYKLINSKASDKDIRTWIQQHYIKADGIILNGLILRRKAEANLYFKK